MTGPHTELVDRLLGPRRVLRRDRARRDVRDALSELLSCSDADQMAVLAALAAAAVRDRRSGDALVRVAQWEAARQKFAEVGLRWGLTACAPSWGDPEHVARRELALMCAAQAGKGAPYSGSRRDRRAWWVAWVFRAALDGAVAPQQVVVAADPAAVSAFERMHDSVVASGRWRDVLGDVASLAGDPAALEVLAALLDGADGRCAPAEIGEMVEVARAATRVPVPTAPRR